MDECAPTPEVWFVTMQRESGEAIKQAVRAQLRTFMRPREFVPVETALCYCSLL